MRKHSVSTVTALLPGFMLWARATPGPSPQETSVTTAEGGVQALTAAIRAGDVKAMLAREPSTRARCGKPFPMTSADLREPVSGQEVLIGRGDRFI
jgi:hypothetical protein